MAAPHAIHEEFPNDAERIHARLAAAIARRPLRW